MGEGDETPRIGSAAGDTPEQLYALWDDAVERSRVSDMIEEYGWHTGHADLLREAVDGRVGEDPPSDWRPGATSRG